MWEAGREYILPALLSVLHQRALQDSPSSSTVNRSSSGDVKVVSSSAADGQSQCEVPRSDGSTSAATDRRAPVSAEDNAAGDDPAAEPAAATAASERSASETPSGAERPTEADLADCVRQLSALYVTGRSPDAERMFTELAERLEEL